MAALRTAAAHGRLATLEPPAPVAPAPASTSALTARTLPRDVALLLPLAVVSSTAAAGVHAAMGPLHFREATLFGLFFAGAALAHGPTPQKIDQSITIQAPPDAVWKVVGDFGGIGRWHPDVAKAEAS